MPHRFVKILRERRQELGLTQEQIAGLLSISRTQLTNIELGNSQITLENLELYASAVKLQVKLCFR